MFKKEFLNQSMYEEVKELRDICIANDQTSLKLELDYKLETGKLSKIGSTQLNEFLYYHGSMLIGYIGISSFSRGEIEINGMVHPLFRRKGLFTKMFKEVMKECENRETSKILLLSDHQSVSGIGFIKSVGGTFEFSEYEMILTATDYLSQNLMDIHFRKATNEDAELIANQNRIYFNDVHPDDSSDFVSLVLPEEEEKKGMLIYLAEINHEVIGKVNLYIKDELGTIYGLGVLPEHRRKGYGRTLLLKSLSILNEKQCKTVTLQVVVNNDKALDLYLNCGFEVTSTMDYYTI